MRYVKRECGYYEKEIRVNPVMRTHQKKENSMSKSITDSITPLEIVTQTDAMKEIWRKKHKIIIDGITSRDKFQASIPDMVKPEFVALYGHLGDEGFASRAIKDYVESLIPTETQIVMEGDDEPKKKRRVGRPTKEEIEAEKDRKPVIDPTTGKPLTRQVPLFELNYCGWEKITNIVNASYKSYTPYWDARRFAEKAIPTIDESLFDKMNDYLWRHIMGVVFPEDVKREFKHFCINTKRKLYYLGERDNVRNQTIFGLYDKEKGGGGKTTILQALAKAFSDDNPVYCTSLESFYKFNADSADKFGVLFVDENPPSKGQTKDQTKQFADSAKRKIEGKGKDAIYVNNLFTIVISANHEIANRLFENEARGQRRDATFEIIGNLVQYEERDMYMWFKVMFDTCPIDDDSRTYKHNNPQHLILQDLEFTLLMRINSELSPSDSPDGYTLHGLADKLEISCSHNKSEWYSLRNLLKDKRYTESWEDSHRTIRYKPLFDNIARRVGGRLIPRKDWWSIEWRNTRPYIDVEQIINDLKSTDYDTSAPITYDEYKEMASEVK